MKEIWCRRVVPKAGDLMRCVTERGTARPVTILRVLRAAPSFALITGQRAQVVIGGTIGGPLERRERNWYVNGCCEVRIVREGG